MYPYHIVKYCYLYLKTKLIWEGAVMVFPEVPAPRSLTRGCLWSLEMASPWRI